jgi:putative MFS transporter
VWYVATVFSALLVLPVFFFGAGDNLWRWAVGFGAVPALIVLILRFMYADESPMWAAHNLGVKEAAKILQKSYGVNFDVQSHGHAEVVTPVAVLTIFKSAYRARTALVSIVSGFQSMEYYAVGFYLPVIIALIFGKGVVAIVTGTVILNLFGIVGGGTQPFLTGTLGVCRLAVVGCIVAAAGLISVGLLHGQIPALISALLIGVFILGHSFGPGSQGKTMATLSYPTEFRGTGTGWAEAMSRVGTILGFYFFPLVLAVAGLAHTLLYLSAIPIIMLISLLLIRWEPSAKDVEGDSELPVSKESLRAPTVPPTA